MGIENLVLKKADNTLIVEGHFSADHLDDQFEAISGELGSFFEHEVHQKFGQVTDWTFIHVVVSAPQLLPVWRAVLSAIRPAVATERIVSREELGAVNLRSHFECIGVVAPPTG